MAYAHALLELSPDVALGGFEAGHGIGFGLINVGCSLMDGHVDAGRLSAGIQHHLADIAKGDTRIGELALDHDADLFPQRLRHAILMMLSPPMFGHPSPPRSCAPSGPEPIRRAGKPIRIAEMDGATWLLLGAQGAGGIDGGGAARGDEAGQGRDDADDQGCRRRRLSGQRMKRRKVGCARRGRRRRRWGR